MSSPSGGVIRSVYIYIYIYIYIYSFLATPYSGMQDLKLLD